MVTDWKSYNKELYEIIAHGENGLLLNADDWYGRESAAGRAAFKLQSSGKCQKEYITFWELFDHWTDLKKCGEMVALKIREIGKKQAFNTIVTCSPPARYLLQLIHHQIERPDSVDGTPEEAGKHPANQEPGSGVTQEELIKLRHMGPFGLPEHTEQLNAFQDEKALIVVDVMATGYLTSYVAKAIEDLGGTPVAVLAIVLTDPKKIEQTTEDSLPELQWGRGKRQLLIHSLSAYPIKPLEREDFDKEKVLPIDPDTLLPESSPISISSMRPPLFRAAKAFKHFEDSRAVDFSFYRLGKRHLTVALRIPRLLDMYGEDIWKKIAPFFHEETIVITTYSRTDLLLKDFVENRLGNRKGHCVLIPRKDTHGDYNYFMPPHHVVNLKKLKRRKLENREVVLLLTTVQTTEKLRNIASLLASHSVGKITVVCLLNRMGPHIADFLARVDVLLRGGEPSISERRRTHFVFIPVYNLPELPPDSIAQMQIMVDRLFDGYEENTRVESFRRLAANYRKYFKPKPLTSWRFLNDLPTPLGATRQGIIIEKNKPVKVKVLSEEGNLFLLGANLSITRDYQPLIEELRRVRHKETLFKIYGILLADLKFIRLTGLFPTLREITLQQIQGTVGRRQEIENELQVGEASFKDLGIAIDQIQECVDYEVYLLFGLSLFSFLDHEPGEENGVAQHVIDHVTCGLIPDEWLKQPLNFLVYLSEDRISWTLSMFLYLANPALGDPEYRNQVMRVIKEKIRPFSKQINQLDFQDIYALSDNQSWQEQTRLRIAKIRANLNSLLTDVGAYELYSKYSVIRFLHREIITQPKRHSPIAQSLDLVLLKIQELIFDPIINRGRKVPEMRRFQFRSDPEVVKELQPLLEDGMYVAGKLQEIAEASLRLFDFTSISHDEAGRFKVEPDGSDFSRDVRRLGDILERTRIENAISYQELVEAEEINDRLSNDLWDRLTSPLYAVLKGYVAPLSKLLLQALREVNIQLQAEGFTGLYNRQIQVWESRQDENWAVLIERPLLREILRNMLSNVRHGLKLRKKREGALPEDLPSLVEIDLEEVITSDNEVDKARYIRLTIRSWGPYLPPAVDEETTTKHHEQLVAEYGGKDQRPGGDGGAYLKVFTDPDNKKTATLAVLQLRSRKEVARIIQRNDTQRGNGS